MTSPHDEPGFLLRMILDKLDQIDKKVDGQSEKLNGQSEKLVSHEIRLSAVEKKLSDSWKMRGALAAATLSALLAGVLPLITK